MVPDRLHDLLLDTPSQRSFRHLNSIECGAHCMPRDRSAAQVDASTAATADTCHQLGTDNANSFSG